MLSALGNDQDTDYSRHADAQRPTGSLTRNTALGVFGMLETPIKGGKRIGAVTHVLVNDPTTGYGIFIENMLAEAKDGSLYTGHPQTGTPIVGFSVPHWDQVFRIALEASEVVPEVGYVGWDIAIREGDVVLIEGNSYPGHDILQLPAYTPDNIGMKSLIADFL